MSGARYYSVRRLAPYQGTIQIVEMPGFRAMSADGETWRVQVMSRGARFSTYGTWREDGSGDFIETARTRACVEALRARPRLPFPLADTLELWLLDVHRRLPLALLASTLPERSPLPVADVAWHATFAGDQGFVAVSLARSAASTHAAVPSIPHGDVLDRCIQKEAGVLPRAQWFRRAPDGSGMGLTGCRLDVALIGRQLAAADFPELLLCERWENEREAELVRDYHDWQAPDLLTHTNLRRALRDRLERAACRRPERLYRLRHLLPEVINPHLVKVAMVEAVLRRSASPAVS